MPIPFTEKWCVARQERKREAARHKDEAYKKEEAKKCETIFKEQSNNLDSIQPESNSVQLSDKPKKQYGRMTMEKVRLPSGETREERVLIVTKEDSYWGAGKIYLDRIGGSSYSMSESECDHKNSMHHQVCTVCGAQLDGFMNC
jgi:ribosomal protein L1